MQEYGYFFNKYSRSRNKGDLYVPITIRILIQISLSSYFLTDVEKLYYICRADALQISRPFKKYLSLESQRDNNKNQRSNGNILYIRKSIRSS